MDIKEYKPLALVFYVDGNGNRCALPLDDSKREQFKQAIEEKKMVELEGIVINTFDIKEIRPACSTSELEKYYYSRTYGERAYIADKVRHRAQNSKVNVIEYMSELWSEKAITTMEWWLKYRDHKPQKVEDEPKPMLTDEDKEELKKRFTNLLSKYQY